MRIFEDFFDDLDSDDIIQTNDEISLDVPYQHQMDIHIVTQLENDTSYFLKTLRRAVYFIENNRCITEFNLKITGKESLFSKNTVVILDNITCTNDLPNTLDEIPKHDIHFIINYNKFSSNLSFTNVMYYIFNLTQILKYSVARHYKSENINAKINSSIITIDDKVFDFKQFSRPGNYFHLIDDFAKLIDMWHTFTNNDSELHESDLIKYTKFISYRNILGALLSSVYCKDSTQPKLNIDNFGINLIGGTYSSVRYISTSDSYIDHGKWTEALTEMFFGELFENQEMINHEKHYFFNIKVKSSANNASVLMNVYPTQEKYENKENCVSIEYENIPVIVNGLNRNEMLSLCAKQTGLILINDLNIHSTVTIPVETDIEISLDQNKIKNFGWNLNDSLFNYELIKKTDAVQIKKIKK